MSSQEVKRQQTVDLLLAGPAPSSIATIVGVAVSTVYTVKSHISNGDGILRKQGSGSTNKKMRYSISKNFQINNFKRSNNFHEKTCQEYKS